MDINLLKILFVILCFQFLFVSFFLFQSKKGKLLSNKILALVFLLVSLAIINIYWIIFGAKMHFPQLLFIDDTFMFAYGPLLYLFTQSVIFKKYKLNRRHLIHFIPFLIFVCIIIGMIFLEDIEALQMAISQVENHKIPMYIRIGELLMFVHIFYYLFKPRRHITSAIKEAYQSQSNINQDNFKSLKFILNSFTALFSISLVHSFLPFVGYQFGLPITMLLLVLFMFYFINAVLFKMLNHATNESGLIMQLNFIKKEKYANSKLTSTQISAYKNKLWNYMNDNKSYLDSELMIGDLAKELDIPTKVLSQIINECYSCNFFDFVNKFRVETAKSIFENSTDPKMTILEVMYESGFNSKSSFNTAFKKFTDMTPSQFKNNLLKSSTS